MIKIFKTGIKPWINTKKVHRVIQFNQETWLEPYIDMNTKLKTEAKTYFEKDFFKLIILFRDIKLLTTDKQRNQVVSESNYHKTK